MSALHFYVEKVVFLRVYSWLGGKADSKGLGERDVSKKTMSWLFAVTGFLHCKKDFCLIKMCWEETGLKASFTEIQDSVWKDWHWRGKPAVSCYVAPWVCFHKVPPAWDSKGRGGKKQRNIRAEKYRSYTLVVTEDGKISCLYTSLSWLTGVPFMLPSNSWNKLTQPLGRWGIRQLCSSFSSVDVWDRDRGRAVYAAGREKK